MDEKNSNKNTRQINLKILTNAISWRKCSLLLEDNVLIIKKKNGTKRVIKLQQVKSVGIKKGRIFVVRIFKDTEYTFKGNESAAVVAWVERMNQMVLEVKEDAKSGLLVSDSAVMGVLRGREKASSKENVTDGGKKKKSHKRNKGMSGQVKTMRRKDLFDEDIDHDIDIDNADKSLDNISIKDFEKIRIVGIGSFGVVYVCTHVKTEEVYAMKVLNKDDVRYRGKIDRTLTELSILKNLDHPFLIKLYYAFQTKENLYIITDFINGGELYYHLERCGRFDEERSKFYAAEISVGLNYLHENNIIYRDLKPENVLIDKTGHVVLTDFGLSKELRDSNDTASSLCGTPEYLAPEIIMGEPYTSAVDWWALGMIIFEMISGNPPFEADMEPVLYEEILYEDIIFPVTMSKNVQKIISDLAHKDLKKRITNLKMIQEHQFFSDIDWEKLIRKELVPPFKPEVNDVQDLGLIDSEYLEMSLESFNDTLSFSSDTFDGFQYPYKKRYQTT
jgi:serine/threonine protein kinase